MFSNFLPFEFDVETKPKDPGTNCVSPSEKSMLARFSAAGCLLCRFWKIFYEERLNVLLSLAFYWVGLLITNFLSLWLTSCLPFISV